MQQGATKIWQEADCCPGELATQKSSSFLLVLDAQSFTEIARAETPNLIPFHFHGQYFDELHGATGINGQCIAPNFAKFFQIPATFW